MKTLRLSTSLGRFAALAAGLALLGGCAGLSGFGGGSQLTCKLPDGARCDSVSNTYAESKRGTLPGQVKRAQIEGTVAPSDLPRGAGPSMTMDPRMLPIGMPVRSQSRVMRVWIKPWEDADGDLHDQSFVYLPVDEGRWMVEHKQREVRQTFAPSSPKRSVAMAGTVPLESRPVASNLPPPPGAMPAASPAAAQAAATAGQPNPALAAALRRVISDRTAPPPAAGKTRGDTGAN